MVSEELSSWVKNARSKGYTDDQLRQYLSSKGHDQQTVDELIVPVVSSRDQDLINSIANDKPKMKFNVKAVAYGMGILLAAIFVFLSFGQSSVACEANIDCNDGLASTHDICIYPGLDTAVCANAPLQVVSAEVNNELSIGMNEYVAFEILGTSYVLSLDKVGSSLVQASVFSPKRSLALAIGQAMLVDVNKDQRDDFQITVLSADNAGASVIINTLGV